MAGRGDQRPAGRRRARWPSRRRQVHPGRLARGAGDGVAARPTEVVVVPEQGDVADELRQAIADTDEQMRRGTAATRDHRRCPLARRCRPASRRTPRLPARNRRRSPVSRPESACCSWRATRRRRGLIARLVDEPITRRMTLGALDDREAHELATQITPGITDRRTIARLVELSGGNPLTLNALADSIAVGEVLPPPASTTGTIPVEVAWRARLSTLSPEALARRCADSAGRAGRTAPRAGRRRPAGGRATPRSTSCRRSAQCSACEEGWRSRIRCCGRRLSISPRQSLVVRGGRRAARSTGCSLAVRRRRERSVRLSAAANRTGDDHHRDLVKLAFDEAIEHGSWSAAGDLAEQLVETAVDLPDRAHWMHRLGTARFNELDRDEATERLIEAADLYESCCEGASAEQATAVPQQPSRMPAAGPAHGLHAKRPSPSCRLDELGRRADLRRVARSSVAGTVCGDSCRAVVVRVPARSSRAARRHRPDSSRSTSMSR